MLNIVKTFDISKLLQDEKKTERFSHHISYEHETNFTLNLLDVQLQKKKNKTKNGVNKKMQCKEKKNLKRRRFIWKRVEACSILHINAG